MGDRLKYLEDGGKPKMAKALEPVVEEIHWPILARYDFVGTGPRPGEKHDIYLYDQARLVTTVGEILRPTVTRLGWILIRLAIGLAILYFVLRGNTFDCIGSSIVFD